MTMRGWPTRVYPFTACVVAVAAFATGCNTTPDPNAIVYQAASPEVNERATAALLECVGRSDCNMLLGEHLDCGPFLWSQLKDHPALAGLGSPIEFTVPGSAQAESAGTNSFAGRRFETQSDVRAFWKVFAERCPLKQFRIIRRLTSEECRIYWALTRTKIAEPIFALASPDTKIVIRLTGAFGFHFAFIDNFQDVEIGE